MLQDPVMAFDRDLNIAAVNPATKRMFCHSAAELIGDDNTILRPADRELRQRRKHEIRMRGVIWGQTQALSSAATW